MTRRTAIVVALLACGMPTLAQSQVVRLGTEFQINTYTTDTQDNPAIATDGNGNFVVVWQSRLQDGGPEGGIFGQHYASTGAPLGTEFQVNTYTTDEQNAPAVAADPSGAFVVVWHSFQDGSFYGVFGQRFSSNGLPAGTEFQVNTYTSSTQRLPDVATDASGDFVVVWQSYTQDGASYGVFGRRFASSGAALGTEFQINTYTSLVQVSPAVAADPSGGFVVVWDSIQQDGAMDGVFAQRFASTGARLGTEFQVNTYTMSSQGYPDVAADPAGGFVVVWESRQDGGGAGVFAQRFASNGARLGTEFQINTYTTDYQAFPAVATDAGGRFVVVWQSTPQDGASSGVFGRRFDNGGLPIGGEFQVNTYTTGEQRDPAIATDPSGGFVVAWDSYPQDGSNPGVFGQRFAVPPPPPHQAPALAPIGLVGLGVFLVLLGVHLARQRPSRSSLGGGR